MNVSIAQRLAALRREHGFTQEQLAEKLGVSRQAVSKWERTESSPDTDNLIALARLYGVTLDELVYGPQGAAGPDGDGAEGVSGEKAAAEEATQDDSAAQDDDAVSCSWDDGVHVDSGDASVSVGWDGVNVHDHRTGDHVEVGPGGVHVNASDGKHAVRTDEDGSVWIDDERYDSWSDAHRAWGHSSKPRAFISKIPYVPLAIVVFLWLGLFEQRWEVGGCLLAVIPVWESLCSVANAVVRGKRGRKLRGAVAGLCFWAGLSTFLVVGLTMDAWHPAWGWILVGLAASLLVDALWPRGDDRGDTAPESE